MWCVMRRTCRGRAGMRRRAPAAAALLATCGATLLLVWLAGYGSGGGGALPAPRPPPSTPGVVPWVVVGAGGAPGSEVCGRMAVRYPGWTVLVYGTDQPDQNSLSRCQYLPAGHTQEGLIPPPGTDLRPASRALLHAIKSGAEAIYVPRPDRAPEVGSPPRVYTSNTYHGLVYNSPTTRIFDAARHFGCRQTAETDPTTTPPPEYHLCEHGPPPALQLVARLPGPVEVRQEGTDRTLRMPSCDARAPPVTLGDAVLAEVAMWEALYARDAFWALGVTQEVMSSGLGSPVVGWALQRLIGLAGGQVLVRHDVVPEPEVQTTSRRQEKRAAQTIRQWTCASGDRHLNQCAHDLFTHLGALRLLERRLVDSLAPWWDALEAVGYVAPRMDAPLAPLGACRPDAVLFRPLRVQGDVSWTRYRARPVLPLANEQLIVGTLSATCPGGPGWGQRHQARMTSAASRRAAALLAPPVNLTHSWVQFQSVMLLVTFNSDHYDVIPYIELLYRPFFPYMAYCGPSLPDPASHPSLASYHLTFLSYHRTPPGHFSGAFNYECFTMASRLNTNVDGYLVVSDDMYVSLTRLTELPLNQAWYLPRRQGRIGDVPTSRECRLGTCDFFPHWRWWEDYREQTLAALRDMEALHHVAHPYFRCHRQLVSLTGGAQRALGGYSDIYFVPRRLAADLTELLELFLRHQVFLEIAVPTSLWCLELPERVAPLSGLTVWDWSRDAPHEHFNRKEYLGKTYLHPTKWSGLVNGSATTRGFYCDRILPHLHDPYGRMGWG